MTVSEQVCAYIVDELLAPRPPEAFDETTPLLSGLLDSAALMRLIAYLEEEFAVTVDDHEVVPRYFETVRAIDHLVASKRQARPKDPA